MHLISVGFNQLTTIILVLHGDPKNFLIVILEGHNLIKYKFVYMIEPICGA